MSESNTTETAIVKERKAIISTEDFLKAYLPLVTEGEKHTYEEIAEKIDMNLGSLKTRVSTLARDIRLVSSTFEYEEDEVSYEELIGLIGDTSMAEIQKQISNGDLKVVTEGKEFPRPKGSGKRGGGGGKKRNMNTVLDVFNQFVS